MGIFQHHLYGAKDCTRHRLWPYLGFYQVDGRCHRDRSGDQLVVGQGSITSRHRSNEGNSTKLYVVATNK